MSAPGNVITSDMPGTEEFSGMSMDDIGKQLPPQGGAVAEPVSSETRGAVESQGSASGAAASTGTAGTGAEGRVAEAAAKATEAKPGDDIRTLLSKLEGLQGLMQNMQRENGTFRALQGRLDKLEAALEKKLAAGPSTATTSAQAADPDAAARDEAEQFVRLRAKEEAAQALTAFEGRYQHLLQPLQNQFIDGQFKRRLTEMGQDVKAFEPLIAKIIADDDQAAKAGDPAAQARMIGLLQRGEGVDGILLRAIGERSKQIQAKGSEATAQQEAAAGKGARTVAPGGSKPTPTPEKKTVENMTQQEIDELASTPEGLEQLGKLLPKQARR